MDENTTIEFTSEEREQIIAKIKRYYDNRECFIGTSAARAIQADYNNSSNCWIRLLKLIESAPAKHNMKAAELADKLEQTYEKTQDSIKTFKEVFDCDISFSSWKIDIKHLADILRNLDATEDGMRWPLDKDDVPIKPGDTVYMNGESYEVDLIRYVISNTDQSISICIVGAGKNIGFTVYPDMVTHKKPRTLDDIKEEAYESHRYLVSEEYKMSINELINEAYEMGKAAGNEEASEV